MKAKSIEIINFRNAEHEKIDFDDGINILIGENAEGKTNLLEALYFASIGKSFRTAHENEVIRFSEEYASFSLDYENNGRIQNISMYFSKDMRKNFELNHVKINKLSELIGEFRSVLFYPDHLQMIKDGPALRRNYLDVAISGLRPIYLFSLQKYYKILKERNSLIKNYYKDKETFDKTIEFWSLELAKEAAVIAKFRNEYVEKSKEIIKNFYLSMNDEKIFEEPEFVYQSSIKSDASEFEDSDLTEKRYINQLTNNLEKEIYQGATIYGIHKDDILIDLNKKSTRFYSSQGQQRLLALAMKLSEGEICKLESGEYPVYLFDDVFSELDEKRRKILLENMGEKQLILTSCEKRMNFPTNVRKIKVENGKYNLIKPRNTKRKKEL